MLDRPLVPREVLFADPRHTSPKISPDGSRLAWVAPLDGVPNVWVRTIALAEDRPLTDDTGRGVRTFHQRFLAEHLGGRCE